MGLFLVWQPVDVGWWWWGGSIKNALEGLAPDLCYIVLSTTRSYLFEMRVALPVGTLALGLEGSCVLKALPLEIL